MFVEQSFVDYSDIMSSLHDAIEETIPGNEGVQNFLMIDWFLHTEEINQIHVS